MAAVLSPPACGAAGHCFGGKVAVSMVHQVGKTLPRAVQAPVPDTPRIHPVGPQLVGSSYLARERERGRQHVWSGALLV